MIVCVGKVFPIIFLAVIVIVGCGARVMVAWHRVHPVVLKDTLCCIASEVSCTAVMSGLAVKLSCPVIGSSEPI